MEKLKSQVIEHLKQELLTQLKQYEKACLAAVERSNESEGRNQTRYDTQKIETAYLANAYGKKYEELSRKYAFVSSHKIKTDYDSIQPGCLIKLKNETKGFEEQIMLLPGEWGIYLEDLDVMVASVSSTLGQNLIGLKKGDVIQIDVPAGLMQYKILEFV